MLFRAATSISLCWVRERLGLQLLWVRQIISLHTSEQSERDWERDSRCYGWICCQADQESWCSDKRWLNIVQWTIIIVISIREISLQPETQFCDSTCLSCQFFVLLSGGSKKLMFNTWLTLGNFHESPSQERLPWVWKLSSQKHLTSTKKWLKLVSSFYRSISSYSYISKSEPSASSTDILPTACEEGQGLCTVLLTMVLKPHPLMIILEISRTMINR